MVQLRQRLAGFRSCETYLGTAKRSGYTRTLALGLRNAHEWSCGRTSIFLSHITQSLISTKDIGFVEKVCKANTSTVLDLDRHYYGGPHAGGICLQVVFGRPLLVTGFFV